MNHNKEVPAPAPQHGQRHRWWTLDPTGSVTGFVFALLSVTPSLLPRPTSLQGVLAALSFGIGYMLGAALWAIGRRLLGEHAPRPVLGLIWWASYAGAWILAVAGLSVLSTTWQNDVRRHVSMPPLESSDLVGFAVVFLPTVVLLLVLGKAVRALYTDLRRRISTLLSVVLSIFIVTGFVTALLFAALAVVNRVYLERNQLPDSELTEPASEFHSAGAGSAVDWHSLGRHGAAFIAGGPTATDISKLTGREAIEPIRVYAGLNSAPTLAERAELVVDELQRTGAFDRKVLIVATTTGSGWLEPQTVDAVEYLHAGDTAIASMQYAYTPSWVSFVFDPNAPVAAARVLFEAVEERMQEIPAGQRPSLHSYGLSLGAHGGQAVFGNLAELRSRTDGALFVGSPNGSAMWRSLQAARDEGSPLWQPVLNEGREVRWLSRAGDEHLLSAPWEEPRVLYLQHATDPITWLAPDLLWRPPEWLQEDQRSPDITAQMRWIPIVTGLHLLLDMLVSEAVPASYGHNYGDVVLTAWGQVIPASNIDTAALERIQSELESYATIPKYEE